MSYAKHTSEYQFQKQTGLKLGEQLKNGNGKIYTIKGHPNLIVKIDHTLDIEDRQRLFKIIKHIKRNKTSAIVKIHKYGVLASGAHYYVMDKLSPLDDKWNRGEQIAGYIYGDRVPKREPKTLRDFIKSSRKLFKKYDYGDVHGGNIMLDEKGKYKFVDLESFTYV